MSKEDKNRLKTLLEYWIEHNDEHGVEFEEWADRAKAMGEAAAGEEISQAAGEMEKTNRLLAQALKRLEG